MTKRVLALLITLIAASGTAHAQAQRPPNIVILLADDLGYADLGSYGNPYIRTPTLDELAREGQRWTDFYVSAPVCSPSRGSLLTGQVPVRSGLYGNRIPVMFPNDTHGIRAGHLTVAEALKSAGYSTGIFGKWHLGDDPDHFPTRHGFDYWFGIPYSNDMDRRGMPDINEIFRLRAEGRDDEVAEIFEVSYEYYENPRVEYYDIPLYRSTSNGDGYVDELVERPVDQPTLTRRLTEEAVTFIERHRDEPFLAYVPYTMPHLPLFSGEAFAGSSLRGTYGDVVEELDWSVARIRQTLEALNLEDDTLVLFTSDNGPWKAASITKAGSAGMLRGSKGTTYEGGMRVPAIFSWPGRIEPGVVSEIGSTMDVYNTVLELAGVTPPAQSDGLDIGPALFDGQASPREEMPYYKQGELRAYRKGRYKLVFYGGATSMTPLEEPALYDLHDDLSEANDIAAEHPEIVAEVRAAARRHTRSLTKAEPIFDLRLEGI